ncbi:MAG: hypothetical protein ACI97A_001867 [Planctomycetota bacterium]|jgi:hypothetical protein
MAYDHAMLDPCANVIFEIGNSFMLICRVKDGLILIANESAKSRLGAGIEQCTMDQLLGKVEADRLIQLLDESDSNHSGFVSLNTLADETIAASFEIARYPGQVEDTAILALREMSSDMGIGTRSTHGQMVGSISDVTNRIMHDVRNLIFPLIGHVELAMASLDSGTDAYSSLLDVQSACRNCEDDLSKLLEIAQQQPSPPRFIHPVDLMERSAMVLGYTLPKNVPIDVDVDPRTPLIEISLADCQQRIVDLAALAFQQRGAFDDVCLMASDNSAGGVTCEIRFTTKQTVDEALLSSEKELTRAFLSSLLVDSNLKGSARSTPTSMTFYLEVPVEFVSHDALADEELTVPIDGHENVVVFHRDAMMRDILMSLLTDKGYTVDSCSDQSLLRGFIQKSASLVAVFADCDAKDNELSSALTCLLDQDNLAVLLVSGSLAHKSLDSRVQEMPRSYRLDRIPAILRQAFDESDFQNDQVS